MFKYIFTAILFTKTYGFRKFLIYVAGILEVGLGLLTLMSGPQTVLGATLLIVGAVLLMGAYL